MSSFIEILKLVSLHSINLEKYLRKNQMRQNYTTIGIVVYNLEIFWTYLLICIIRTDEIQTIYSTLTRLKTNLISLKLHVTYFLWEFQMLSLILFDILYFNKR